MQDAKHRLLTLIRRGMLVSSKDERLIDVLAYLDYVAAC
jgi:hypothetical protein